MNKFDVFLWSLLWLSISILIAVGTIGFIVWRHEQHTVQEAISTWAPWTAALGTVVLAFVAFRTIQKTIEESRLNRDETRRLDMVKGIREWAKNGMLGVSQPSLRPTLMERKAELDAALRMVGADGISARVDAEKVDSNRREKWLYTNVLIAVKRLNAIVPALQNPSKNIDLPKAKKVIAIAFTQVIRATSEYLYSQQ